MWDIVFLILILFIIFFIWKYVFSREKKNKNLKNIDITMKEIYYNLLNNTEKDNRLYSFIANAEEKINRIEYVESEEGTWVANKGQKMGICLKNNKGIMYDDNVLRYVLMHELSHIISPEYVAENHEDSPIFMEIFKHIIEVTSNTGKYKKIDYSKNPINYCGIILQDNL